MFKINFDAVRHNALNFFVQYFSFLGLLSYLLLCYYILYLFFKLPEKSSLVAKVLES